MTQIQTKQHQMAQNCEQLCCFVQPKFSKHELFIVQLNFVDKDVGGSRNNCRKPRQPVLAERCMKKRQPRAESDCRGAWLTIYCM